MCLQARLLGKTFITIWTDEFSRPRECLMSSEVAVPPETSSTLITTIRLKYQISGGVTQAEEGGTYIHGPSSNHLQNNLKGNQTKINIELLGRGRGEDFEQILD